MTDFLAATEAYVEAWHGIPAPNRAARILAAELADTVAGFERQRGRLRFEDEPATFEAALQACKDPASKDSMSRDPA